MAAVPPEFAAMGLPAGASNQPIVVQVGQAPVFVIPQQQQNLEVFKPEEMSKEQCRAKIHRWTKNNLDCCGKDAAASSEFKMRSYQNSAAYCYRFQSFVETRKIGEASKPFKPEEGYDGPQGGLPPTMWEFVAHPKEMFCAEVLKCPVPHTDYLKKCESCDGVGSHQCKTCEGRGFGFCKKCDGTTKANCRHCDGTSNCKRCNGTRKIKTPAERDQFGAVIPGTEKEGDCDLCGASGRCGECVKGKVVCQAKGCAPNGKVDCTKCKKTGRMTCTTCDGQQMMKHFQQLTISYTIEESEQVEKVSSVKARYVRNADSQSVMEFEDAAIAPVHGFHSGVDLASSRFAQKHAQDYNGPDRRILRQKHMLTATPVHEVQCSHQGKNWSFFIVGFNQKVHCDNYPTKGCCTIC